SYASETVADVAYSWSLLLVDSAFVFFFSSRRRHTRLVSDWSSDVCSSDLAEQSLSLPHPKPTPASSPKPQVEPARGTSDAHSARSEERRVGKEWRSRWWAYH